jgi:hypothetical protein
MIGFLARNWARLLWLAIILYISGMLLFTGRT